ncbi:MAG TPA: hypothetical protein VFO39_17640 [Candidatus Sulfotelmatobacter sp.]|nr:hypothetical protein [Candidatus Sulfotelmatobacter sp.]
MTAFYDGEMTGGDLILLKYGLVVPLRSGDVIIYDTHEYHCNLPLEGEGERFSCVFYYRTEMQRCCSPREELRQLKHRKLGDPLFKSSDSASASVPSAVPTFEVGREHAAAAEERSVLDEIPTPGVIAPHLDVSAGAEEIFPTHPYKVVIALLGGSQLVKQRCAGSSQRRTLAQPRRPQSTTAGSRTALSAVVSSF